MGSVLRLPKPELIIAEHPTHVLPSAFDIFGGGVDSHIPHSQHLIFDLTLNILGESGAYHCVVVEDERRASAWPDVQGVDRASALLIADAGAHCCHAVCTSTAVLLCWSRNADKTDQLIGHGMHTVRFRAGGGECKC